MKKRVLIYPGNSYSAESVYTCLCENLRYEPIMANHGTAHAQFITNDFFDNFPLITDDNFIYYLNDFIDHKSISFLIPTHDTVADYLMKMSERINCTVVCSCAKTTDICRHKRKTYNLFHRYDFVPHVYENNDEMLFPVFIKDDIGQGGKNSYIVRNKDHLSNLLKNSEIDYVITEYLPGKEITVDCFTNRYGQLLYNQPRMRETILTGMSGRAKIIRCTDEIQEIAQIINHEMKFRGYWYFQCKQDADGKYKLMEISTRFAGTFPLTKNLDVNLPLLSLTDFDDIDVKIIPNHYEIEGDRGYKIYYRVNISYDRVYFDFDDTLVRERKTFIIPSIAFLFQCINEGKKIILLTRHAYSIYETLAKMHLDKGLFDQIIEISEGKSKAEYIENDKNCIFIDNSFAERMDVKEKLDIPTFDVCNLECLLRME